MLAAHQTNQAAYPMGVAPTLNDIEFVASKILNPKPINSAHIYEAFGVSGTVIQLAKLHDININTVYSRIGRGKGIEDALTAKRVSASRKKGKTYNVNKMDLTIQEWSKECGKTISSLYDRIKHMEQRKLSLYDVFYGESEARPRKKRIKGL